MVIVGRKTTWQTQSAQHGSHRALPVKWFSLASFEQAPSPNTFIWRRVSDFRMSDYNERNDRSLRGERRIKKTMGECDNGWILQA